MPTEPTRPPSPPRPGRAVVKYDLLTLRYRTLLGYLFLHPKLALSLLCIRPFVVKSLVTMMALCVAGGLAMAKFCSPWEAADIRRCLEFIHQTVGDVRVAGGRLEWADPGPGRLPASVELGRFLVTVSAAGHPADPPGADGARSGLVLSPERLWCWSRSGESGDQLVWQELPTLKHLRGLDSDGQFSLTRENLADCAGVLAVAMFLTQWALESSSLVAQWLLWCVMMILLSFFGGMASGALRRNAPGLPLRHRLAVGISLSANLTLVPLLAAVVYAIAGFGTPSSLAGVMFLVYMIYAAIEGYRSRLGFFAGPPDGGA